ncbi:hypothetical protein D3C84_777810 [compost metagenome]
MLRRVEGRRGAPVRPGQPAAIDQQPEPGAVVEERLQQLDADLAVVLAVIQQDAVLGVELALQRDRAKGRVGGVRKLAAVHRRCHAALGVSVHEHTLLFAPAQLPEPQAHHHRHQHGHHQ